MPKLVRCSNCGAPLRADPSKASQCSYCGAALIRDTSRFEAPPPFPPGLAPKAGRPQTALVALGVALVMAGFGFSFWRRNAGAARSVSPTPAASSSKVDASKSVPLERLGAIDVTLTVESEKQRMPREFPEAQRDMYGIEYTFDLAHPALKSAAVDWEWGCNCFSHVNVSFKDYPAQLRAAESFVPCIAHSFGAPSRSNPPFSYEWEAKGQWPRLSVAQTIRVDLGSPPVQQRWQRTLEVIDRCARTIVEGSR